MGCESKELVGALNSPVTRWLKKVSMVNYTVSVSCRTWTTTYVVASISAMMEPNVNTRNCPHIATQQIPSRAT
eukprot:1176489-Prorocentrum_minimum.AAC.1